MTLLRDATALSIFLAITACATACDVAANRDAEAKRDLCESTGGTASDSACGEPVDDGVRCRVFPLCGDSLAEDVVSCACPEGQLYDEDAGCLPNPDPVCAAADSAEVFTEALRGIAGDDAIDCGRNFIRDGVPDPMRDCLIAAHAQRSAAIAILDNPPERARIFVLAADGTSLDTSYIHLHGSDVHIERHRCEALAPAEPPPTSRANFRFVFECLDED